MIIRQNNKIVVISRSDFNSDYKYYNEIYNIINANQNLEKSNTLNSLNTIESLQQLILFYK